LRLRAARVTLQGHLIPSVRRRCPARLFKRNSQDKTEIPCPRCKTLVPIGDDVCNVCGWDMLDQYRPPEPLREPAGQEDRAAS
jgi:hypothetical protein